MSTTLATEAKPWYKKPENIAIYGGLIGVGYLGLLALDKILPLLVRVLENGIYASFLAAVLGVIVFLAVNGDIHRLAWYGYKSAMRWVTGMFVQLDPIGIMKTYVETLRANLAQIKKSLGSLQGQAHALNELVASKAREHEHSMSMAAEAKKRGAEKGMRMEMRLQARKAGRAEQSTMTYQGLLNRVLKHIAVMEKVEEAANFMIADIEDTVQEETKKREMIHASHKAMTAARRILATDKQRELYDMALEATTKDYHDKLGEITQFMNDSQHFINTMDLENGVFEEEALSKLEAWEERSLNLLSGGTGKTSYHVLPAGESSSTSALLNDGAEDPGRKSFADLFGNLDK